MTAPDPPREIVEVVGPVEPRDLPHVVSVRLPADTVVALRDIANRRGETVSDLLRTGAEIVLGAGGAAEQPENNQPGNSAEALVPRDLLAAIAIELRAWSAHWTDVRSVVLAGLVKHDRRMADGTCGTCALLDLVDYYAAPRTEQQ